MQIQDITSKAFLISVNISLPGNIKQDADITSEVLVEKGISDGAGRWVKTLYPPESFKPFQNISNEARGANSKFITLSLPWTNSGFRIIPATTYFDVSEDLRNIKQSKFLPAIEEFKNKYNDYKN